VKPIVYQHQSGGVFADEMSPLLRSVLRDLDPAAAVELVKTVLGLDEAAWDAVVERGFDPDTYVFGQARDTLAAVDGRLGVYMASASTRRARARSRRSARRTSSGAACSPPTARARTA
jgi:hypothetical protein